MDVVNDLILAAAASPWLLLVMFAVAIIDGFFPPVPSETVLVAAAAAAASTGGTNIVLLAAVAATGAMIGDNIAYAIGRGLGTRRFGWMRRPRVAAAFDRAERTLARNGAGLILGARYIPVGRVAVNMTAGALRYPWRRFLPLSALAGLSWAVYSAGIGMLAGHWIEDQPLLSAVFGIAVALILGFAIDRVAAIRRRRAAETPAGTEAGHPADAVEVVPAGAGRGGTAEMRG
ncbi:DedA family protein [Microbacterium sp. CIAB417]|uniref:DedA family protein n=1 Tax=Microbacterium sp. CIAB417 TaxID=2860287 RepID=UPI001FAD2921|nr:DedA family protein [Microbacterium sp. CIAB417]